MNACSTYEPLIADLLFGALSAEEQDRLERHLDACPGCRALVSEMQAALRLAAAPARPEPGPAFWDGYYERLEARRMQETARETARTAWTDRLAAWWRAASGMHAAALNPPAWRLQLAAALALLAVGVLIGWLVFGPSAADAPQVAREPGTVQTPGQETPPEAGPLAETPVGEAPAEAAPAGEMPAGETPQAVRRPVETPVQAASLDARADRYLERSKVLLLGLVNLEPDRADAAVLNLPRKQETARALVQEAGPLKAALREADRQRLRELIADLEVILLQIANLEADHDVPAIELVKSSVDRRGILLKINLTEMQQADGGVQPALLQTAPSDSSSL